MNSSTDRAPRATRRLLKGNRNLFRMIHNFNMLPAGYIHPSWIEPILPLDLFQWLIKSKRGLQRLSEILLYRYNLANDYYYDFIQPQMRLALIPPETLSKLVLYCGIALNHHRLSTWVDNPTISKVKLEIGEYAYRFGLERASLLSGSIVDATYFLWDGETDFKAFAERCGTAYFLSIFSSAPRSILTRLLMKFTHGIYDKIEVESPDESNNNRWLLLKRILISEIAPQWRPLFS